MKNQVGWALPISSTKVGSAHPTKLHGLLRSRRLPLLLAILAILLALPSLWVGWVMDDHIHRIKMLGSPRHEELLGSPMDLFTFFDGDSERTFRLMDIGLIPWWTLPEIKTAFWRPVTVLTHWLDYRLWPRFPALMHAQSLLWFGGLVAVVTLFYRRLLGATWIAGLAALLYAIDDARGMPVGFLANRNALLATLFGVLALLVHDRWRRGDAPGDRRWGAVLGPLLLAASLLSAEAGVATLGYLFAYAVFLDEATWRRRLIALVPYGGVLAVWRLVWWWLGYGISGMGLYMDPVTEPARYLQALGERAPLLLLGQWALPPSDIAMVLRPEATRWLWLAALVFVALVAVVLIPLMRRDRVARFWGLGMVLSVVPICATFPSDRLLFFVGLGGMGLLAQFLGSVFSRSDGPAFPRAWRVPVLTLGFFFLVIHLVFAPVALSLRAAMPIGPKRFLDQLHVGTPLDDSVEQQDVVIINAPSAFHAMYLPILRELRGEPVPRHTRILAPGYYGMRVNRPDVKTLVIRPKRGYLDWMFHRLFRAPHHPLLLGERVELTGMTVEITALTADGRPAEAAFQFSAPLEDASLRWLQWKDGNFVPFTPPEVGETIEMPPAAMSIRTRRTPGSRRAGSKRQNVKILRLFDFLTFTSRARRDAGRIRAARGTGRGERIWSSLERLQIKGDFLNVDLAIRCALIARRSHA